MSKTKKLQKELDRNRFMVVRYGLYFILATITLVLVLLGFISIDGKSILQMVIDYYVR
ncbi:hypothetical protein [Altibacter sp. HG106]|uniref:hypothetical protein n=1 Tax=Altibacter sp. HG106 TaxID=3023937 RepID=UPI0023506C96|nr:hypothetical protein [Altibacter sp. HG106]MDC7995438.1 hypothetical protein [Altibacter sp. HG106]